MKQDRLVRQEVAGEYDKNHLSKRGTVPVSKNRKACRKEMQGNLDMGGSKEHDSISHRRERERGIAGQPGHFMTLRHTIYTAPCVTLEPRPL